MEAEGAGNMALSEEDLKAIQRSIDPIARTISEHTKSINDAIGNVAAIGATLEAVKESVQAQSFRCGQVTRDFAKQFRQNGTTIAKTSAMAEHAEDKASTLTKCVWGLLVTTLAVLAGIVASLLIK